ncbi:MAG: 1-acyl-sn-glycerol-3-phosphate acyltransferase [Candidatus Obscuribacterales bacterium]|nr:1-acyl-sn-glycerol-3-phosphate acyltransferase [Candidatus Obscuribacterales bacterium]
MVSKENLEVYKKIPRNAGIILTPNHADEMDPRVCFELSRITGRRMVFMCNREAFDEIGGIAGWFLQRLGAFSVERGGHDVAAKQYAIKTVIDARNDLVIFPEGEIFYLNESVQPFHSGAIDIGLQAIEERRMRDPDWEAYILPLSIKYRFTEAMHDILEARVKKMEEHLAKGMTGDSVHERLKGVMSEYLRRGELEHNISADAQYGDLAERIERLRHVVLSDVGAKYKQAYAEQSRTIDKAFQLGAHLRERLSKTLSTEHQSEYTEDLGKLKEVQHLVSWRPDYVDEKPSAERLAEMTLKLERELFKLKRPEQLGKREVTLRLGEPIGLSGHLAEYKANPHSLRSTLADLLRSKIQSLINES